jgi:HSP20 family molecular chaperone IbpA
MKNKLGLIFSFLLGALFAFSITYSIMDNANRAEREELIKLRKAMLERENGFLIPNPFAGMGPKLNKLKKQMQDMMEEQEKKQDEEDAILGSLSNSLSQFGLAFDVGKVTEREDENFYYYDLEVGSSENNKIEVNVKDNYLMLSGTIEKVDGNSSFTSSFNKSFPIPADADASLLEVDSNSKENFLIIKVPRKK